jgi:hypothetical protein
MATLDGDPRYVYWSTDGFPATVNGFSGFTPREYSALARRLQPFPDAATVELLRGLGVETVVLYPRLALGTPWARAATRPTAGLDIERSLEDGAVVYDLTPAS